jgi:hypothetical protein
MHPMGCFEKAAMDKMGEVEGSGPRMLVIKLKMPSEGGYAPEKEDTGDMPSGEQGYGSKAKMIFDAVNDAVGMKSDWTPEIEKKLVEKLGMMLKDD